MTRPFYTIGHSTRSLEEFVELLLGVKVTLVADVRTVPRSRTNPQYNRDVLPDALVSDKIGYEHLPALGGLRSHQPDVPASANAFWETRAFTTMLTTPWVTHSEPASPSCESAAKREAVRSCVRRQFGGGATVGS